MIILMIFSACNASFAQNVGIGTNNPHPSAVLELQDNTRGFLPPRMTFDERNSINNPIQGLIIYCTDCGPGGGEPQYFDGKNWLLFNGSYGNPPSVRIGQQIWMKKNLDVSFYSNGDTIPQVTDPTEWANLTTGAWCYQYNYLTGFGKLYNWYAVTDPRGLAPLGWRVPSGIDFDSLVNYLGGYSVAGGKLKDTIGYWQSPNVGATNSSGFSGLPGGYLGANGVFQAVYQIGYFWTTRDGNANDAWVFDLPYFDSYAGYYTSNKKNGFSVRCIKN